MEKKIKKEEIKCYKIFEKGIFKKFDNLNEDKLNTKSNESVYVKKYYHDKYY